MKPRTALACRLIDLREKSDFPNRSDLAAELGIPTDTLGTYERGVAEPGVATLARYREITQVNLSWLVSGFGEMFDDPLHLVTRGMDKDRTAEQSYLVPDVELIEPEPTSAAIDDKLFLEIRRRLKRINKAAGISLPEEGLMQETVHRYNQLVAGAMDLADPDEVDLLLRLMEKRIVKEIDAAKSAPGTGKRSA